MLSLPALNGAHPKFTSMQHTPGIVDQPWGVLTADAVQTGAERQGRTNAASWSVTHLSLR